MSLRTQDFIYYYLEMGIRSQAMEDLLTEAPVVLKTVDPQQSRIMNRPSTRQKLRKAMMTPTTRMKIQAGYQRWLKAGGRQHLQQTAKKRFELSHEDLGAIANARLAYEHIKDIQIEVIQLIVLERLINIESLLTQFDYIETHEDETRLERCAFLYDNYHEEFIKEFITACVLEGVVLDTDQNESTLAGNIAVFPQRVPPTMKRLLEPDDEGEYKKYLQRQFKEAIYLIDSLGEEFRELAYDMLKVDTEQLTNDPEVFSEVANFLDYLQMLGESEPISDNVMEQIKLFNALYENSLNIRLIELVMEDGKVLESVKLQEIRDKLLYSL